MATFEQWRRALVVVLGVGLTLSCWPARRDVPSAEPADFVVATYNLNFGLGGDTETLEALAALDADVVVLQETNATWEEHIRAELSVRYPHQRWLDATHYPAGGSAILSRYALDDFARSESTAGWFDAIGAVVSTDTGDVRVIGVHLKPPVSESGSLIVGYFSTPGERLREMQSHMSTLWDRDLPTVVAGDFNEERRGGIRFLQRRGFEDAVARFAPGQATWHWPTSLVHLRLQLDHIFYDERLVCLGAEIFETGRSDHFPIVARFSLRQAR